MSTARTERNAFIFFMAVLLQGLQVLDEIALLLRVEAEGKEGVVVVDDVAECGETTVVVEAALLVCEQPLERRSAVALVGRAFRLEVVNADLFRFVHVPARLGVERRD